ncbi:hypothetical protein O1L44_01735 [Streptomyces noursei]|nr:hypothetical protein [Streptomyces noursei]
MAVDTVEQQNDLRFLRKALGTLLGEPSYGHAAERLRHTMEAMPPPAALVPELARIAAGAGA